MTLYKNRYRVESTRLQKWDYSSTGLYFITICTRNLNSNLCSIVSGKIKLSDFGIIVSDEWLKIEEMRPGVKLDEWVIMPNHLHGIIFIEDTGQCNKNTDACNASLQNDKFNKQNLSNIIRGFKSAVTKRITSNGKSNFEWQSRFFDHIVRSEKSLDKIREYIYNNPFKWESDKYYNM